MTDRLTGTIELAYNMELHLLFAKRLISSLEEETDIYLQTYDMDVLFRDKLLPPVMPQETEVKLENPKKPEPLTSDSKKERKRYNESLEDYNRKKEAYDNECERVRQSNEIASARYNADLHQYNQQLKERIDRTNLTNTINHCVKYPIIISKIKLVTRSYEETRMTLDNIYQKNEVDYAYRDIVSLYVFRYYLKKGLVNAPDDLRGLIAQYKKDEEQNNIPMQTELPDVKNIKNNVTLLIEDFRKNLQNITEFTHIRSNKIDLYINEQKNNIKSLVEYYNEGGQN